MKPYTLQDLESRERLDADHAKPARLAVLGHPVGHSASPRMHQPALDEAGINARYIAIDIEPGDLRKAFERMQALDFIGCNVTVPHKFEALAACDETDAAAQQLGVVNTVHFAVGSIRGTNTDGVGFAAAVKESLGLDLNGRSVLIAGAGGGAGAAIAAHCVGAGVATLVLANRSLDKIEALAAQLAGKGVEVMTTGLHSPQTPALAQRCSLLVNTSSLGLREDDPCPLPKACFTAEHAVFDTIYEPSRTSFIRAAEAAGARTANGAGMLLHQGVRSFQTWFPESEPTAAMRRGLGRG